MNDELVLEMKSEQLGEFYPLLQQGFAVTVRVGCTLDLLLSREFGLSPDYVTKRITTIFLNGQAVDDIKRTVVREGAVIALSGAAPGLVGAILRRGGHYAALRGGITYRETGADATNQLAQIRVKLFNILLPELGPHFLRRGITLTSSELANFLAAKTDSFWQGCRCALVNNTPVASEQLKSGEAIKGDKVVLTVKFEP